jgi:flagellar hook-associated protein 3 FlgL
VRVTDKMIFDNAALNGGRARQEAEDAVQEASTGVRVEHPWDDPAAAGLSVSHTMGAARFSAIGSSVQAASDELTAADGALNQLTQVLTRAQQISIQLTNSTYSAADRNNASAEAQALVGQAVALLNTRFGDRYVFGGNKDRTPPFDAAGNYNGDDAVRMVEIAPGELEAASLRADVFAKGVGGGVDLLGSLQGLATALSTNDQSGIQAAIDNMADGINQVSKGRTQLGGAMNLFDTAAETSRVAVTAEQKTTSQLIDADVIQATSRLALAQRALDASLTASARSFDLTLLDKLQ